MLRTSTLPQLPSIYARAEAWHKAVYGAKCECLHKNKYPCATCAHDIARLVDLLDQVIRDVIEVTTRTCDRIAG